MAMDTALPLWAAVFGTIWQLAVLLWGIIKFPSLISFCKGSSSTGNFTFVKNALLLSLFSYAPLTAISICFMWVGYDKNWQAGPLFVMLPALSILLFFLFLLATVNDITKKLDVNRRGRKRLPMQAPPTLIVGPGVTAAGGGGGGGTPGRPQYGGGNFVDQHEDNFSTPRRAHSAPPELPLQQTPM